MITVTFQGSDRSVEAFLNAKGATIATALQAKMQALGLELQRHIQADKLSGQVLKVRTGTLRRSINERTTRDGSVITTTVGVDPTASIYGRVHEYGGTFHVKEHVRHSIKGTLHLVRAHDATYPQRSFMRTGLADMKQTIIDGIHATVKESASA